MPTAFEKFGDMLAANSIEHRVEPFKLRAGGISQWFIDLRAGHADPALLIRSGRYMLHAVRDERFNRITGVGVDGRAVVSGMLMAASELPYRSGVTADWGNDSSNEPPRIREPKNGHGFDPRSMARRKVLAVDGTLTSGSSLETLIRLVAEAGGLVIAAAVVVDRSNGATNLIAQRLGEQLGLEQPLRLYSVFTFNEVAGILLPTSSA